MAFQNENPQSKELHHHFFLANRDQTMMINGTTEETAATIDRPPILCIPTDEIPIKGPL